MATVWPEGKGIIGGRCSRLGCHGRMVLLWTSRLDAEWYCEECGLTSQSPGRQAPANAELRHVVMEVFEELENKGINDIKLQPFLQVCDALSRALYDRPVRSISLRELESMGLETYVGLVRRKKVKGYSVHDSSKGRMLS